MNIETLGFKPPEDLTAWMGNDPIPTAPYYDPEYYELERKAIFMRSWLVIGHKCEIAEPGSFIRRELEFAKASILIVHGKDGVIRAFHNVCTHRGTQLVDEDCGQASAFLCPYHRWNFGYDGQLRAAPELDRFSVRKEELGLIKVAVDVCGGLLFINLDPSPQQTLQEFLGTFIAEGLEQLPVARATTFSEYVYEIDANWKMTYDNFQENYHLRFIHPSSGLATFSPENPYGYPDNYGFYGPHRTQTIWSNPTPTIKPVQGEMFQKTFEVLMKDGLLGGKHERDYFAIFPSFFILGAPSTHFSHMVYPLSATKSRGVIRLYWVGEDDSAAKRLAREYGMATARDIHTEDVDVITRGQKGLNSGALKVMHFQALEGLCRHLYLNVNAMVEAYKAEQQQAGAKA